mgnify:CR=1 FL=1
MTFDQFLEMFNTVLDINWDALIGILIALVFLRRGSGLLLSEPDGYDTDPKMKEFARWRPWVLGLVFWFSAPGPQVGPATSGTS